VTRSCPWTVVPGLVVLVGVCGLLPAHLRARAQSAHTFPDSVTVSAGPRTNLFDHVMKKADVLEALAQVQESRDLFVKNNAAVTLRAATNTTKLPFKLHPEADELWFVYRGSAKVNLAPFSLMLGVTPPGNTYNVGEGDIVNVPRGMAYQIVPAAGRFEYVAVRKFAVQVQNTGRTGGPGTPQAPLPPVTTKAQLDQWYNEGTAGTLGIQPGINRIIFDRAKGSDWHQGGAPGPWENHEQDEHVDFVVYGTAKCTIDGFITGAHWDNRGVMGSGVVGGSESTVGVGDIVFVFRNTAHFFDPISSKFGYLLVNMPQSEPYWPKSIIPNGTGAY
jgi:mannose-6-phosphate isomerase-like protein (cupin superfamily)